MTDSPEIGAPPPTQAEIASEMTGGMVTPEMIEEGLKALGARCSLEEAFPLGLAEEAVAAVVLAALVGRWDAFPVDPANRSGPRAIGLSA